MKYILELICIIVFSLTVLFGIGWLGIYIAKNYSNYAELNKTQLEQIMETESQCTIEALKKKLRGKEILRIGTYEKVKYDCDREQALKEQYSAMQEIKDDK